MRVRGSCRPSGRACPSTARRDRGSGASASCRAPWGACPARTDRGIEQSEMDELDRGDDWSAGFSTTGGGERGVGFRRCFVKPGRGRWGRSRKICPPLLSASLFTAHLPRVKRGAGVTRGLIRTVPIFGRTEAREKAKRGTRRGPDAARFDGAASDENSPRDAGGIRVNRCRVGDAP